MKVLVVGGSGYLGAEVVRRSVAAGHRVAATYRTARVEMPGVSGYALDVRDRAQVADTVAAVRPDVVVNAAYRKDDWVSCADGAAYVALAAVAVGARLVHVSSDAVFAGTAGRYAEAAVPDPVTPYGAAKAAAETAVRAVAPHAVVARTSLIVGDGDSVHERRVHELAARPDGVLFTDVVRCPVHVGDLAGALLDLAGTDRAGIHHLAGGDALTRYELGVLIARRDGLDPAALPSGPRADGPSDIRLDCAATRRHLRTELRGARTFLAAR